MGAPASTVLCTSLGIISDPGDIGPIERENQGDPPEKGNRPLSNFTTCHRGPADQKATGVGHGVAGLVFSLMVFRAIELCLVPPALGLGIDTYGRPGQEGAFRQRTE